MFARNLSISTAVCAALALAGLARADVVSDISMVPHNSKPLMLDDATQPTSAPTATAPVSTPVTALNGAMGKIPGYADTGLSFTGYVEGSWTYSAHPPAGNILVDRVFDTKTESIQFDNLDLLLVRAADPTKAFDIGFTGEVMYGWDAAYIHSNGLTLVSNGHQAAASVGPTAGTTALIHPKAQLDINQAYFVLSFGKIGNGLTITGGKFDTLLGYEVINAVANNNNNIASGTTGGGLYSHSFIFDEEPFTHTGLFATYNVTDPTSPTPLTVTGGFSRGWDESTEDNNGDLDIMGQIKYVVTNKAILQLTGITGNEQPSGFAQDGWRTVIDFVGSYALADQFTVGVNGMFAWQAQDKTPLAGPTGIDGTGIWYGAAAYAKYIQSDYLTFNARLEWFDDQNGGAPTQLSSNPANVSTANQFYEVTLGLSIKPFPHDALFSGLVIRPEGRWDYSDHAAFNGGAQHDQWTGAVEAYFSF